MYNQLLTYSFKNSRYNFLNSISQAKQAALNVFIVIFKNFVKLIKELYFLLNNSHPPEVKFEKQKES